MTPADVELRDSFVLTVSPLMFYKLACWSQDHTNRLIDDEELADKCAALGLPVEKMKYHLTKIVVDKSMSGNTWR